MGSRSFGAGGQTHRRRLVGRPVRRREWTAGATGREAQRRTETRRGVLWHGGRQRGD